MRKLRRRTNEINQSPPNPSLSKKSSLNFLLLSLFSGLSKRSVLMSKFDPVSGLMTYKNPELVDYEDVIELAKLA